MKFTKIPNDTFKQLQLNAGILAKNFIPSTGIISGIIGATSGGVNFVATPSFIDFGEDIDNCPKNTKELKKLDSWEAKMSGTFVTVTNEIAKMLVGVGDIGDVDTTKITPRIDVEQDDFEDIWWVGDYSDKNGNANGGFIAIHLLNGLSTGGFQIQSTEKAKGTFSFEFTGHYSINEQETPPFEIYVKEGTSEEGDYYTEVTSVAGSTTGKTSISVEDSAGSGESYVYATGYGLTIPSQGTIISGSMWTSWDGSAEITATTGMDIVVVIKDSDSKSVHAGKTKVVSKEA